MIVSITLFHIYFHSVVVSHLESAMADTYSSIIMSFVPFPSFVLPFFYCIVLSSLLTLFTLR